MNLYDMPSKMSKEEQGLLLRKYLRKKKDTELRTRLSVSFLSFASSVLKKHYILNDDNLILVFQKIYRYLPTYKKEKSSLYTFIYHIIHSQVYDILRKSKKEEKYQATDNTTLLYLIDNTKQIISKSHEEHLEKVRNLLTALTKKEKDIIYDIYWLRWSKNEILEKYSLSDKEYKLVMGKIYNKIREKRNVFENINND